MHRFAFSLAVVATVAASGCVHIEEDDGPAAVNESNLTARLATRIEGCTPLSSTSHWVRTRGRVRDDDGVLGHVRTRLFSSMAECESIEEKPLPRAYFYGGLKTWGWLALGDQAKRLETQAEVTAHFDELCSMARDGARLGSEMKCHADLIGVSPRGWVRSTEALARDLIDNHGATVSIDVRTSMGAKFTEVEAEIDRIFNGKWGRLSSQFLDDYTFELSLDLEPQVGPDGGGSVASAVSAAEMNRMCAIYRNAMIAHGHDGAELRCFLYEYSKPTMIRDPEHLDPWIYPVVMSSPTQERIGNQLEKEGVNPTMDTLRERGLDVFEEWMNRVRTKYPKDRPMGCMFFSAPYLGIGERNPFTYAQGVQRVGELCDIYSFQ